MRTSRVIHILISVLLLALASLQCTETQTKKGSAMTEKGKTEVATFAGGCFWCTQAAYHGVKGIIESYAGYTGGHVPNPTYEQVVSGTTGHSEALQIRFDPKQISYEEVLDIFWRNINPTQADGQFFDRGTQYQTAIYYHSDEQKKLAEKSKEALAKSGRFDKPIVTAILPAEPFYPAEEYHQEYHEKNPIRYEAYKIGSGRDAYLKSKWPKEKKAK